MRIEHWFYELPLRVRSLFHRRQVENELDEELQYHLEQKTNECIAQGLSQEDARYAALRAMDGLTQRKEECRDKRRVNFIEDTIRDIRYGVRILRKSPTFTTIAVLTLALAIGANAVVFGILNGLILRPLNVPHVESLWETAYGDGWQSYPNYVDLRERNRSFTDLAAYNFLFAGLDAGFDTGGDPTVTYGFAASGNYFDVLELQPYLGRFFHSSDEHGPASAPYMVLTYSYWRTRFHADPNVVGRTVRLNKHPFTIIGVAPPDFYGTVLFVATEYFIPIVNQDQVNGQAVLNDRGSNRGIFEMVGHLKPGVTPAQAVADINTVSVYLEKTYPKETGHKNTSLSHPGLSAFGRAAAAFVSGLMVLAGLILFAACANLGNLFAARAAERSREVALRLALGSSRSRILRGLLTEAVLISLVGGAIGLWCSVALLSWLTTWQPFRGAPIHIPVGPDANVYIVAFLLALASGFLFGIVPVRQVLRTDPYQIIKAGPAARTGRRLTARDLLVAVQIAICAVLVTSSMVALRGLVRSIHSNFGFEPRNTMLVGTNLAMAGYGIDKTLDMQKRMIDGIKSIPGVDSVGLVNNYPPLGYASASRASIFRDNETDLKISRAVAWPYRYEAGPGYFQAAGTALLAGRSFSWHDEHASPAVAVVNREFARRIFGSVDTAIGRYYKLLDGTRVQIVGVVEDGKYLSVTEDQEPAMFLSCLQWPMSNSYLVIRSSRDPQQIASALRAKIRQLDAGLPTDLQSWTSMLAVVLFPARMATVSLGVLGIIGAVLSITGIFGMAAYALSKRLKELGIRLALGAQRHEILQAALGRALKLLAIGSTAGLILGILASRVLAHIVYQATPRDPLVLTGVVLAMALLGLVATWIPAQRALSLDPMTLLREE